MSRKLTTLCLLIIFTLVSACVSSSKHEELENAHKKLGSEHEQIVEKNKELQIYVAELEQKLGKSTTDKNSLKSSLAAMKAALSEATERKRETEKRLTEYRNLINKFKNLTAAGQLSIKIVDGRMVVALPSDILFASGSARLSAKGQDTIKQVSQILVSVDGKKFQVEGHTDNVPIRSQRYPSNWELASARATNVVKTMIEGGMPQTRLSAASFAANRPVATNDTKEGKSLNRRIEVVVVPDLSSLPGYDELQKLASHN